MYQFFFVQADKIPKKHPIVGDKVKVLSPQFGAFFRAEVLKKKNDGSYDIFYIDYGNVENVSANKIYELADELLKVFMLNNFKTFLLHNYTKYLFCTLLKLCTNKYHFFYYYLSVLLLLN